MHISDYAQQSALSISTPFQFVYEQNSVQESS